MQTQISTNLDTVLYLYKKEEGASSWGRYLAKNDDHKGHLWSQIDHKGEAGQYRVIVKGHKASLRGAFSVLAQCQGEGCPAPGDQGGGAAADCSPEETKGLPGELDLSCATPVYDILSTPVSSAASFGVRFSERCELEQAAADAVDYYASYWDDFYGFTDLVGQEDGHINVQVTRHGEAGTIVGVDVGADEDFVSFVFDGQGRLLFFFHDEQSPTANALCQAGEALDEECAARALYDMPHGASAEEVVDGKFTVEAAGQEAPALVTGAMVHHLQAQGLDEGAELLVQGSWWKDSYSGDPEGARLTLGEGDQAITYLLARQWDGELYLIATSDAQGQKLVCGAL